VGIPLLLNGDPIGDAIGWPSVMAARLSWMSISSMREVREFAGHADIRTTEVYFIRNEEDDEVEARRIQIRLTGRKSE
jgi:hypothetical protein